MAYVGTTNVPANNTSGLALFTIKETLKLAGWSVLASGTGTSGTTSASDLITTGTGTAIGSFARASAWVRIREPGGAGAREYVLQNGNADNSVNVIIKYSRATGFNAGGTATVAPTTGGDGVVWIGTGTDAAPVQTTWLPGAATGYYHAVANNVAVNGVYGWWWYGYLAGGSTPRLIGTEAVSPGSTAATDQDPSVRYRDNIGAVSSASQTVQWWEAYGLGGATYRTARGFGPVAGGLFSGSGWLWPLFNGLDPYTGKVPMFSSLFGDAGIMAKGYSTEAAWFGTVQNAVDTFNLSSAQPKITLYGTGVATGVSAGFALPWVTSVVPLV